MHLVRLPSLLLSALVLSACTHDEPKSDSALARATPPPVASAERTDTALVHTLPPAVDSVPTEPLNWVPAESRIPAGFDSAVTTTAAGSGLTCHVHARYVVVSRDNTKDDVGSDVIVRGHTPGTAGNCTGDSLSGDFVLRNQEADYFLGLRGDRLFIDVGTGAISDLVVYDLRARRKLEVISGYEIEGWRDNTTLELWVMAGETTRKQCPKVPEGMGVGIDSLHTLDLTTMKLTPTGRWRCAARE